MLKFTSKIMIVDDHPIVRCGIVRLIDREIDMEVCCELDGTENIPEQVRQTMPDLLILDISLRNADGIAITRSIRAAGMKLPIIILSMHENKVYVSRALRAGADGYVVKSQSSEQLVRAIREVRQGRMFVCCPQAEDLTSALAVSHPIDSDTPLDLLSDRERQIFIGIGRGLSTAQIAEQLDIRPKTVESYRARIKAKLELDSPRELNLAAIQWATSEKLNASAMS